MNAFEEIVMLKREVADLRSMLENLVRTGRVTGASNGKAKVVLTDADGVVTHDYSTLQKNSSFDQDIKMPDVGELVQCLSLPRGSDGIVLGSIFSEGNQADSIKPGEQYQKFADGGVMGYDRNSSTYNVTPPATGVIRFQVGASSIEITTAYIRLYAPLIMLN